MGLCVVRVQLLQGLGDSSVQPHPPRRRQLILQRLLYQRVGELVTAYRLRKLLDDPG